MVFIFKINLIMFNTYHLRWSSEQFFAVIREILRGPLKVATTKLCLPKIKWWKPSLEQWFITGILSRFLTWTKSDLITKLWFLGFDLLQLIWSLNSNNTLSGIPLTLILLTVISYFYETTPLNNKTNLS